jgi:hypothetical protein
MGFIVGIMLTVLTVTGVYYFLKDPAYRAKVGKEFGEDPVGFLFVVFGALATLTFLWGVVFRPLGDIVVPIGVRGIYLWQFAGLCALAWLVIGVIAQEIKYSRPRR